MPTATLPSSVTIINNDQIRGVLAPASQLSQNQLNLIMEDLADAHPDFLNSLHAEYETAKKNHSFISSAEMEKRIKAR
jgi:hypothetical protein